MATQRKIKCDCGLVMEPKQAHFEGFDTEAMVCPKCGFTTLTKEQAQQYAKIKQLHRIIDAERKIIRIGNSMGFILPDGLREFGVKVGRKIKTRAIGENSFKVEIV